ncbi:AAA+ family ATPase [Candidatus Methanoperedens nitroreducens]|uniref:AAA+ family ATPase n=1 Tax=Candidatus Methanoperedens nitratireducens TaxID=1392998 RepID=A0A062V578_9EURY|nr:ATP-binding protein [Candidatus Methanoperedens nitroreducens]KCZ70560.1 AAA+ family ATPase [Candidatus Methanoperedens nitroreducens]MDJ1420411.1 ATP-binding protein [Candidatus Methanoperedens sp.]
MNIYENNLEHLLDELRRIDLIISLNLEKWRAEHSESMNDFQGLYVSESEVDAILQASPYQLKVDVRSNPQHDKIETITREINIKKVESIKAGKELRLHLLSWLFHLQSCEVDILLICLVPELDLRYEKLYSYLQDDVTKKRPTVDLVINLLSSSMEDKLRMREIFSPTAPLIRNHLVYLTADDQLPLLSRSIKVDDRIISFILGSSEIDQRIRNFSAIIEPKRSFGDIILSNDTENMIVELIKPGMKVPMLFFHGSYGTGKKMMAEAVCRELNMPLFVVDSGALKGNDCSETVRLVLREALLQNSALYLEGFDALPDSGVNMKYLLQELDLFPNWVFLSGERAWKPTGILKNHCFINISYPLPSFALRKKLWESFLNGNISDDVDTGALASKFKLSGGQIRDAIFTAHNIAMAKGGSRLSMDDLYQGCKTQSNRNLTAFARKIEPIYTWEDLILPKDIKKQLKEVSGHIKYRGTVYTDWGFDKRFSMGKGLNVLFSGPSGTGKTMTAEIIAREAGLDLYKIDLSGVVSKYIGETEKNLGTIFKEAETSNAVLFFDEADALFGKRSEVKDAHDRYANIEIGYLLQKMEEYEGVVILATNLSRNIDDAFLRRIQFMVEFPFPDEIQRKLMWTGIFPKDAPVAENIDYKFLSEKLKLAGGNIKNIALAAAFYAAEESCEIGMHHIMHAAKREYQKIGKPFLKTDFEPYYELIEADER